MPNSTDDEKKVIAVTAPMAGIILSLNVGEGAKVVKGDILAMLEIMKMETEITAPSSGIVESIAVTKGQEVNMGDTLMQIATEE